MTTYKLLTYTKDDLEVEQGSTLKTALEAVPENIGSATIHKIDGDGNPVCWYGVNLQTLTIGDSGAIHD